MHTDLYGGAETGGQLSSIEDTIQEHIDEKAYPAHGGRERELTSNPMCLRGVVQEVGCLVEDTSEFVFLGRCSKRMVVAPDIRRCLRSAASA